MEQETTFPNSINWQKAFDFIRILLCAVLFSMDPTNLGIVTNNPTSILHENGPRFPPKTPEKAR